jgi:hypothetical protein
MNVLKKNQAVVDVISNPVKIVKEPVEALADVDRLIVILDGILDRAAHLRHRNPHALSRR